MPSRRGVSIIILRDLGQSKRYIYIHGIIKDEFVEENKISIVIVAVVAIVAIFCVGGAA